MKAEGLAPDDAVVVLCTAPDDAVAASLARGIVEARLAACVNVVGGLRSFYRWDGAVQDEPEVQLVIKTRGARLEALEAYLVAHHPYDVPELLVLPTAGGSAAYLAWLRDETA